MIFEFVVSNLVLVPIFVENRVFFVENRTFFRFEGSGF